MFEEILLPFLAVFAIGSCMTLGIAATLYTAMLVFGVRMTFDQFTTRMVALICSIILGLFLMG